MNDGTVFTPGMDIVNVYLIWWGWQRGVRCSGGAELSIYDFQNGLGHYELHGKFPLWASKKVEKIFNDYQAHERGETCRPMCNPVWHPGSNPIFADNANRRGRHQDCEYCLLCNMDTS